MSYRLLTYLLWPVFFIYTVRIALRDRSWRYFKQRLGYDYTRSDNTIWIHCASVGEVNTYAPLHHALLKQSPDQHFIITTNTTTGAATVSRHHFERTRHVYLPIENSFAIRRFLKHYTPSTALIMETEIWPLLYNLCHKHSVNITIINARLSHRTLEAGSWIKKRYQQALARVDKILCKSEAEQSNFIQLGASAEQLIIVGNLKFAAPENTQQLQGIDLGRDYCVAASTHHDEEIQLARLWQQIKTKDLLVIVPRHPDRRNDIQAQLKQLDINFSVRSKQQPVDASTKVYLADTLGELNRFYVNARLVIIGGSIIKRGGQNLLEPARLGKAIICGPHMYNFADETELLLQHKACMQCNSLEAIRLTIESFVSQPELARDMGQRALSALKDTDSVTDDYIKILTSTAPGN